MAETPHRVQLRRTKGWRMPPNTVKVDRSTRFGNPFHCNYVAGAGVDDVACELCDPDAGYCCLRTFREYVVSGIERRPSVTGSFFAGLDAVNGYPTRTRLVAGLDDLRGKNLACWCALDRPCHADILLELANADPARDAAMKEVG